MNVIITLPKFLVEDIISGKKNYEMRKCLPQRMKSGEDGFFVVEKGTHNVRCWCRVDYAKKEKMSAEIAEKYKNYLGVPEDYILKYADFGKNIYLWHIANVCVFNNLQIEDLGVYRNPQQFIYCPTSNGTPHF